MVKWSVKEPPVMSKILRMLCLTNVIGRRSRHGIVPPYHIRCIAIPLYRLGPISEWIVKVTVIAVMLSDILRMFCLTYVSWLHGHTRSCTNVD